MLSKSYYAKRGDRRKGYSELEKQVKELTDYVKEKVHTSKQIEDLESSFDRRLNSIQEQVSLISGFMKSLFDKGVK
jgi:DNA-binding PadR family transcriptional regulator